MKQAIRVLLIFVTDIIAAGLCLCVFAYFHHVKPVIYSPDISKGQVTINEKTPSADINSHNTESDISSDNPVIPTDESIDNSDFSAKFPDVFTDGEIVKTNNSYKSANISATLTKISENGITYYVTDFYIRNIDNIRSAFAQDNYGKGVVESIPDMSERNNAIASINGDYYGTHTNRGVIIRNGILYRANEAYGDVLVMYDDGSMAGMFESDYNIEHTAFIENAWQGWCFGPILVINGEARLGVTGDISGKNPRTGIGYFEPGHYCFITVDGRQDDYSNGMTYDELAECFASLGCKLAYNLDGGQSAMMTFGGSIANRPYKGGRDVSDIIYIGE